MPNQLPPATSKSPKFDISGQFTSNSISSIVPPPKNRNSNPVDILKVYFYFN